VSLVKERGEIYNFKEDLTDFKGAFQRENGRF